MPMADGDASCPRVCPPPLARPQLRACEAPSRARELCQHWSAGGLIKTARQSKMGMPCVRSSLTHDAETPRSTARVLEPGWLFAPAPH